MAEVTIKEKKESLETQDKKIQGQLEESKKKILLADKLFKSQISRNPKAQVIVIDNFYNNPVETRNHVLSQDFRVRGNYPGQRTISYATEELKTIIQKYVLVFGGRIVEFHIPKADKSDADTIYNGAFQYTTSRDRSWVHIDGFNNWAGVLFLTPDAPITGGTGFYQFHDGSMGKEDQLVTESTKMTDNFSQDMTKWKLVDRVGNIFNRMVLFNSHNFHMSMDYFGDCKENARLFQVFFFSTER